MDVRVLVEDNLFYLQQALTLIDGLSDDLYARNDLPCAVSGVGKHIRHVVGFYECLLGGSGASVDYDRRPRDPEIETERTAAREKIREVMDRLRELEDGDARVRVRCDERFPGTAPDPFTPSTLGRELQFLVSHTIHHYAIVAILLRTLEHAVPREFGVAPSTLLSASRNRGE